MDVENKILLIDYEEDIRLGAKFFLAGKGVLIDVAAHFSHIDFEKYKLVIVTSAADRLRGNAAYLEKPYTAADLENIIKQSQI